MLANHHLSILANFCPSLIPITENRNDVSVTGRKYPSKKEQQSVFRESGLTTVSAAKHSLSVARLFSSAHRRLPGGLFWLWQTGISQVAAKLSNCGGSPRCDGSLGGAQPWDTRRNSRVLDGWIPRAYFGALSPLHPS